MFKVCIVTSPNTIEDAQGNTYQVTYNHQAVCCLYDGERIFPIVGWLRVTPDRYALEGTRIRCPMFEITFEISGDVQELDGNELVLPVLDVGQCMVRQMEISSEYPGGMSMRTNMVVAHPKGANGITYAMALTENYTKPKYFAPITTETYWTIGMYTDFIVYYVDRNGDLQKTGGRSTTATFCLLKIRGNKVVQATQLSRDDFEIVNVEYYLNHHTSGLHGIYGLNPSVRRINFPMPTEANGALVGLLPDGGTIGVYEQESEHSSIAETNTREFVEAFIQDLRSQDSDTVYKQWCEALTNYPPSLRDENKPYTSLMGFLSIYGG